MPEDGSARSSEKLSVSGSLERAPLRRWQVKSFQPGDPQRR